MKLNKIIIKNFRCFGSLELDFDQDVNVIVGVNGVGKTALLDAIAIVLNEVIRRILMPKSDTSAKFITNEDFRVLPTQDNSNQNDNSPFSKNFYIELDVNIGQGKYKLQANYTTHNNRLVEFHVQADYTDNIDDILTDFDNVAKNKSTTTIPFTAYYSDRRRFSDSLVLNDLLGIKTERLDAFTNCFDGGANYEAMCRWFFLRTHLEMSEREKRKDWEFKFNDLQAIRDVFNTIFETDIRIFYGGEVAPNLMVEMSDKGATKILKLDQLSAGYRNQIAMILDFAHRLSVANPHCENPLESPGILLIDEIELHLHPQWQQTIIPNLRKIFPNTQLIVTTHSPQVLTTIDCQNIRILKNNAAYSVHESTKGAEAKRMLENILETESRPPDSEIGKKIKTIYDLINEHKLDNAQEEINKLENIKLDEPQLIEAETLIKCERWKKESGL